MSQEEAINEKKRSRPEEDTDLLIEKQPKQREGDSPTSSLRVETDEADDVPQETVDSTTTIPHQLAFTVEEATFTGRADSRALVGSVQPKIKVLRFEVKSSDIDLKKRLAKENTDLFDETGDCLNGWKKNDHFIFSPPDEPIDPEADAPLATSAHPIEQAWMTRNGIMAGNVWHDTAELCPTQSIHMLVTGYLAVQVVVTDGPVTSNMLIQAFEQALDTPLSHPQLEGVVKDEEKMKTAPSRLDTC